MKNKRSILFEAAKQNLDLEQTNTKLCESGIAEVSCREYLMWQQSIAPILNQTCFITMILLLGVNFQSQV